MVESRNMGLRATQEILNLRGIPTRRRKRTPTSRRALAGKTRRVFVVDRERFEDGLPESHSAERSRIWREGRAQASHQAAEAHLAVQSSGDDAASVGTIVRLKGSGGGPQRKLTRHGGQNIAFADSGPGADRTGSV
jgi:hypothetical protein